MMKLTLAVLLLTICMCSTFDLNDANNFPEDNEFRDQPAFFDQPENLNQQQNFDQPENVDQRENFDQPEYQVLNVPSNFHDAEFENDDEEINAIQGHVKYQDAARQALLKLARELRKGKNITNAFFKVIDGFEKGIAEFQSAFGRRRIKPEQISRVREFIREAGKNRKVNTNILRALTAEGIFFSEKLDVRRAVAKRSDDDLARGALAFLDAIERDLGEDAFDEYLSVSGLVTLMFAMDTTGSMSGDLEAAVQISKQIVNAPRDYNVDYILSPFNDPSTGPITRKSESEGDDFIKALEALRATGGGDCPELAIKGIINALDAGPQPASSMYVFTDASSKDVNEENKNIILDLAHALEVKLNFFTRRDTGCSSQPGAFEPYEELASETGGYVYPLRSSLELKQLGRLVSLSLQGSVAIGTGGTGGSVSGRRRRATEREYPISVDESIESLSITVTTQNSGASIRLIDTAGNTVTDGRVPLLKGVVYTIDKPVTGVYKLIVPADVGDHRYSVNAASGINIDFSHYYVLVAKRGSRIPLPLDQPLQGFPAKAFVTIAGAEYAKAGSLRIKVLNETGAVHSDVPLTAVGTSGVRHFIRFNPPTGPFKLQLHGQTLRGNKFARISSREDRSTAVLLKLSYKEESNILRRGQIARITVVILRGDVGDESVSYTFGLKDERGYGKVARQPRLVHRGRQGFARIEFDVPINAPAGKLEKVELSLTKKDETVASLSFSLLIV